MDISAQVSSPWAARRLAPVSDGFSQPDRDLRRCRTQDLRRRRRQQSDRPDRRYDSAGWTTYGASGSGIGQFSLPHVVRRRPGPDLRQRLLEQRRSHQRHDGANWTAFGTVGTGSAQLTQPRGDRARSSREDRARRRGQPSPRPHRRHDRRELDDAWWPGSGGRISQFYVPRDVYVTRDTVHLHRRYVQLPHRAYQRHEVARDG